MFHEDTVKGYETLASQLAEKLANEPVLRLVTESEGAVSEGELIALGCTPIAGSEDLAMPEGGTLLRLGGGEWLPFGWA